jgi:glutamate dehydrogenase
LPRWPTTAIAAVRLYRDGDGEAARIKIYRLGGLIPLSEAVPVFENFGFRVIEENADRAPTARGLSPRIPARGEDGAQAEASLRRAAQVEAAIAAVLRCRAENDAFNALIVDPASNRRATLLFRAWFRYLRQTGLPYGLQTVAMRCAAPPRSAVRPDRPFDARHDPGGKRERRR